MVITTIEITMIAMISGGGALITFEDTHVVQFNTTKQVSTHLALLEMVHRNIHMVRTYPDQRKLSAYCHSKKSTVVWSTLLLHFMHE